MKKIIFATICLIAIMSAQETKAQYADYYYHRVGDTLEWRSPIGYYSWWEWEDFYNDHLRLCANRGGTWGVVIGSQDSAIMLQRFYTPTPLKIIGIAGACFRGNGSTYWTAPDTNDKQDYLFIYDAGPGDTFDLVSQTPWSPFDPKRYIHVKTYPYLRTYDTDHCCIDADAWDIYLPISEYYFDSAIYVTDSFYVGGSFFGNRPVIGNLAETFRTTYMVASVQLTGSQPCSELQYVSSQGCTFPDVTMKLRTCQNWAFGGGDYTFADNIWTWHPHFYESVVIFPLIEVDTTVPPQDACDSVSNVQATVSGTSAVITWDGFPNHTSLLLKYGSCALPRDLWQQVDVTDLTLYTLTDLNPSSCYRVSIKATCDKDEMNWTTPVTFYTGTDTSNTDTTSISAPSILSANTFLQPNPARDEVIVSSSFNLSRIEITDLSGVLVYSEPAYGHRVSIPIGFLRAGTYIVTVKTHLGTTHKRLIVAP